MNKLLLILIASLSACKKNTNCCETEMKGVFKPFAGFCGNDPYINGSIVMNGENYSIGNISDFDFDNKTEQEVTFCGSIDKSKYFQIELTCINGVKSNREPVSCTNYVNATVKDLTGLDGCGMVLELENGSTLELNNLKDFPAFAKNDTKVKVSYVEEPRASICMVGKTVKIVCMEAKTSSN
jgi:hypothetical protein